MTTDFIDASLDIGAVNGKGVFEGYASVFDQTDSVMDTVVRGAFKKSLAQYRENNTLPPLLWQHDTTEPIGKWLEMYEDSHGLFVRGELFDVDIPRARQALKLVRENALTGLSIGFKARQSHRDPHTGARILTEIDLLEVSLVTFPAQDVARVLPVKNALKDGRLPDERSLEAFLRDAGFSRKQAKGFIAAGYKSLTPRDAGKVDNETETAIVISRLTDRLYRIAQS